MICWRRDALMAPLAAEMDAAPLGQATEARSHNGTWRSHRVLGEEHLGRQQQCGDGSP